MCGGGLLWGGGVGGGRGEHPGFGTDTVLAKRTKIGISRDGPQIKYMGVLLTIPIIFLLTYFKIKSTTEALLT